MNYANFPSTIGTLMSLMQDDEPQKRLVALGCFYERYRKAIGRVLEGKLGIQSVDADEILNDFMVRKLLEGTFIEKYVTWRDEPKNCHQKFRQYLARSINNFAIDWMRRQRPNVSLDASEPHEDINIALEAACDVEWLQELLASALRQTREYYIAKDSPHHWEVFLELWLQPDFLGTAPPSHEQIAVKYQLTHKVGTILTNAQRMFTKHWRNVLAEELGTVDSRAIDDALRNVRRSIYITKYIDARQLMLQIVRDDRPTEKTIETKRLSRLVAIASDRFYELLPSEQEMLFQCYLGMLIADCLPPSELECLTSRDRERTFESLLADPYVAVETLSVMNRALGKTLRLDSHQIPNAVAGVIRYAIIAAAENRHQQHISSVPRSRLVEGMTSALDQFHFDARIRDLLVTFIAAPDGAEGRRDA